MTRSRFLALLQSMLVLLLLAGVSGMEPIRSNAGLQDQVVERLSVIALADESTSEWRQEAKRGRDRIEGDGPDQADLGPARPRLIDRGRIIAIGCDFAPNAPPSHRPCAAPPTGPPLV